MVDLRIGSYQSRCVVAEDEASVGSIAKAIVERRVLATSFSGMSETTIVLEANDCYRLSGFSWEVPEGRINDRVYEERRLRMRQRLIVASRVISDAEGVSVYVRKGRHLRRETVGRVPDEITVGDNLCRLLQVSGGQETEVAGTKQVVVFVSCREGKLNLVQAGELASTIRKRTGIGGQLVTQITIMINECASFRDLAFPVWYAFEDSETSVECGSDWKSMIFGWQGQLCVTNEDGRSCIQR